MAELGAAMDRLSTPFLTGKVVAPEQLGINFNFTQVMSSGTVCTRDAEIFNDVVRYPSGNVTELYFNPGDTNNPIAIIQDGEGGLIEEEVRVRHLPWRRRVRRIPGAR